MIKIGVTGTRSGMSADQRESVSQFFDSLSEPVELHHGDCIGVDVEVAILAKEHGFRVVCHPPAKSILRAYHESDEIRAPLTYFFRNRNITDETDTLIVVPFQSEWQSSGGTWYTYDYAKKKGKPVVVFFPKNQRLINHADSG